MDDTHAELSNVPFTQSNNRNNRVSLRCDFQTLYFHKDIHHYRAVISVGARGATAPPNNFEIQVLLS